MNSLNSLSLGFLICKMGIIASKSSVVMRINEKMHVEGLAQCLALRRAHYMVAVIIVFIIIIGIAIITNMSQSQNTKSQWF